MGRPSPTGAQIGQSSDFNNGTGAIKKKHAPGNMSQQNSNPFGSTERGFKPMQVKKKLTGGLSARNDFGGVAGSGARPPMMPGRGVGG